MNNQKRKISVIILGCFLAVLIIAGTIFARPILTWYKNKTSPKVEINNQDVPTGGIVENKNIDSTTPAASNAKTTTPSVPTTTTQTPAATTTRPTKIPMSKEISLGNSQKPMIALTLDAGASASQAPAILKILRDNNVHVTFFLTGKWAEQNPAIIKEMAADGNTFGNHTYDHTDLTTLSDAQIKDEFDKTETIVKNIVPGSNLKPYFRPPYGSRNSHVLQVAADDGYQSIYWTTDALDWMYGQEYQGKLVDNTFVKNRILNNAKNGSIFLMHIGDDITPAILQDVITGLKDKGYEIVTVDQLLK